MAHCSVMAPAASAPIHENVDGGETQRGWESSE